MFSQEYDDSYDLFVGSLDGSPPLRLTDFTDGVEWGASWSRDGKWVYFTRGGTAQNREEIWRIPSAGDEAIQVTRGGAWFGRESPDSKYVLYSKDGPTGIWRVPIEGGVEEKVIETGDWGSTIAWDAFEGGICYVDFLENVYHLRCYDHASGKVTDLANMVEEIIHLTVSPDGEWILLTRQDASGSDLMLVENFR